MGRPPKINIAKPPEHDDLLDQISKLKWQLEKKDNQLVEKDEELSKLEYSIATDLVSFEKSLAEKQRHIEEELAAEIQTFPIHRVMLERDHTGFNGQKLTTPVLDKSRWTQDQQDTFQRYEQALLELDNLRKSTLVAVTLIDDPDVVDGQLNCGVNGDLKGVYYSSDYMVEGAKEGRRVQLVPYMHYDAIMKSYKVRFKPVVNATGGEGHLPYKLSPVVEAALATEEQIAEHKKKMSLAAKRRNMEFRG